MDNTTQYGQMDFNLPHDVVTLPSKGRFYKNKKSSLKVGYLTAADENILLGQNTDGDIIQILLKNKIYEPDFHVDQLLDCDIEAILIFLRNTSFGSEYTFMLKDPKTLKDFEATTTLDELDIKKPKMEPNDKGYFEFKLPKTGALVECRLLTVADQKIIREFENAYPKGMTAPVITKRMEMQIMSVDGNEDKGQIVQWIQQLPIADSKYIRNTLKDCEPRLDLERVFIAPSGEKVSTTIAFGAEFFRPFF